MLFVSLLLARYSNARAACHVLLWIYVYSTRIESLTDSSVQVVPDVRVQYMYSTVHSNSNVLYCTYSTVPYIHSVQYSTGHVKHVHYFTVLYVQYITVLLLLLYSTVQYSTTLTCFANLSSVTLFTGAIVNSGAGTMLTFRFAFSCKNKYSIWVNTCSTVHVRRM